MKRAFLSGLLVLAGLTCSLVLSQSPLRAATIYESGMLGPTGVSQGSVAASNITPTVFAGVRFYVPATAMTTQVGGHFVDRNNGTFFGAIVELDDSADYPDSGDFSTPDFVGAAELRFPDPSGEVFGDLTLSLDPGWYALVFGSGLFGTSGDGAAPVNNPDIGSPSYVAYQPGFGWSNLDRFLSDFRFVIRGDVVPEPATLLLSALAAGYVLARRRASGGDKAGRDSKLLVSDSHGYALYTPTISPPLAGFR